MDLVRSAAAFAAPERIDADFVSAMAAHYNNGTATFNAEHLAKQNKGYKLQNLKNLKEGYNKCNKIRYNPPINPSNAMSNLISNFSTGFIKFSNNFNFVPVPQSSKMINLPIPRDSYLFKLWQKTMEKFRIMAIQE